MTQKNPDEREAGGRASRLLRLVFLSTAVRELSATELAGLEATSRRRNSAFGITGLLLAQSGHYVGVLEGPESRLLARMEIIATDPRHRGLRILREQTVPAYRFTDWRLFRMPAVTTRANAPSSLDFAVDLARRLA